MSAESYVALVVPVNIRISYRFCHCGSVLVFGKSALNSAALRSPDFSLITGSPALTNAFRFVGHAVGAGLNNVSNPIASPDHRPGFTPLAGKNTCKLPSISPGTASFEPTAYAANGAFMLPVVTTAPLASVNVIEPIDEESGSQPGVTDAAAPIPATVQTRGPTTSGAMMAARTTTRVVCQLFSR